MTDKREPYSSQTRQTRSALGLSSATLFIYSMYGSFPTGKKWIDHPGQFQIPVEIIGPTLLFSTLYFLGSFVISARYDRIPIFNYNVSRDIKATLQLLKSAMKAFEKYKVTAPQRVAFIIDSVEKKAEKLDQEILKSAQSNLQDNTPPERMVADTIAFVEYIQSGQMKKEAVATIQGDIGADWDSVRQSYAQVEQLSDRLKSKVTGISNAKNFYLELLIPTAGAAISIATFFICALNNAPM